jgi:hypothetical protein
MFVGSHFGLTSFVIYLVLVSNLHKLLFVKNLNQNNVQEFLAKTSLKKLKRDLYLKVSKKLAIYLTIYFPLFSFNFKNMTGFWECLSSVVKSKNSVGEPMPIFSCEEQKQRWWANRATPNRNEAHEFARTTSTPLLGIAQPYDSSQVLKMTKPTKAWDPRTWCNYLWGNRRVEERVWPANLCT